jgi:hypothetical protein
LALTEIIAAVKSAEELYNTVEIIAKLVDRPKAKPDSAAEKLGRSLRRT